MTQQHITLDSGMIAGRGRTLNPFVILDDAAGFIAFAEQVFDAAEVVAARTPTPTGKLIHAELRVGDSLLLLADPQEGWGTHPGMFQVWVSDAEALVARAVERGAALVTPPTPFYGSLTLARVEDPGATCGGSTSRCPNSPTPRLRGRVDRIRSSAPSTTTCAPTDSRSSAEPRLVTPSLLGPRAWHEWCR